MSNQTPLEPAPEGFAAGTMILTLRGLTPIETVTAGDEVFTHERRWQPVTETMSAIADTVRVHCATLATGLVTTADHPFHARTAPVLLDGGPAGELSAAGWTRVRDLTDRHRLASPLHFGDPLAIPDLPAPLADADPVDVFRTAGAMIRLKGSAAAALRPELVDWLAEHFGQYGAGRRFPAWALTMPETLRIAFLVGLVHGAPHRERNQVRMHSKAFMVGLRLLVCSLGFAGGLSDSSKPGWPGWQLHWQNEGGRRPDFDGYRWHGALRAERGPKAEVFALRVADGGSYLADGITA